MLPIKFFLSNFWISFRWFQSLLPHEDAKMRMCVFCFSDRVCVFVWFLELWNVLISYLEFGAIDDFHFFFRENFPSVLRNKQISLCYVARPKNFGWVVTKFEMEGTRDHGCLVWCLVVPSVHRFQKHVKFIRIRVFDLLCPPERSSARWEVRGGHKSQMCWIGRGRVFKLLQIREQSSSHAILNVSFCLFKIITFFI